MCKFFSAVVLKSKVLFDFDQDSHEQILTNNNIKDDTTNPKFVRVELMPPNDNFGETDLSKWEFKIDQDYKPDWFDEIKARKMTEKALQEVLTKNFLINVDIPELKNQNIRCMYNSNVGRMCGSSNVGWMYGSSNVGEINNLASYNKNDTHFVSKKTKVKKI